MSSSYSFGDDRRTLKIPPRAYGYALIRRGSRVVAASTEITTPLTGEKISATRR
jgi:hypothetical protein